MTSDLITYEQPLNERMRVFMRLEYLLQRAHASLRVDSPWAARMALLSLLRIQDVLGRVDVKQDLIKTLERQQHHVARIAHAPQADSKRAQDVLDDLSQVIKSLHGESGQMGYELKDVDILNTLRQNALIPGGDSGFEQPYLHYWLRQEHARREQDMKRWFKPFQAMERAITLTLWLTRAASQPKPVTAKAGFYNQTLNRGADYQLARVSLPNTAPYFAVISGNPHRINLRFMVAQPNAARPVQVAEDVEFELTLCPGGR